MVGRLSSPTTRTLLGENSIGGAAGERRLGRAPTGRFRRDALTKNSTTDSATQKTQNITTYLSSRSGCQSGRSEGPKPGSCASRGVAAEAPDRHLGRPGRRPCRRLAAAEAAACVTVRLPAQPTRRRSRRAAARPRCAASSGKGCRDAPGTREPLRPAYVEPPPRGRGCARFAWSRIVVFVVEI